MKMARRKIDTHLAIVIPIMNAYEYLHKALLAVKDACGSISYRVYIVDNGSNAQNRRVFWNTYEGLANKVMTFDKPLGFPQACNIGASAVREEKYLLFLNSDCVMSPNSIEIMINKLRENQKIGVIGAKLIFPVDGNMGKGGTVQHAGLDFDIQGRPTHTFIGWSTDNPKVNKAGEVDGLTGACLLTRKSLFDKAGGFDQEYGLGTYEDISLCLNIREQGYIIYYEPTAVGEHYVGTSAKENNIAFPLNNNFYLFSHKWGSKIRKTPWTLWRRL